MEWVNNQIEVWENKKLNLNINENFESDINSLNEVKYSVNSISSEIASLNLRKNIIIDAKQEFESKKSEIDTIPTASPRPSCPAAWIPPPPAAPCSGAAARCAYDEINPLR